MESDLIETMEIDNLREALEAMKPDRDEINWSKRLMVMQLAEDLAWTVDNTEAELDAAILSIIGHFFTPPGGVAISTMQPPAQSGSKLSSRFGANV